MNRSRRLCVEQVIAAALLLCAPSLTGAADAETPSALQDYVARPEPDFRWTVTERTASEDGRVLELRVVSQKWHGIVWEHAVEVVEPAEIAWPHHALLFVTGGNQPPRRPDRKTLEMAGFLADRSGTRVVVLHQVPNQPLFDNRREDDLITETWLKYLETGDETWPLLFPMVKSAVKTMDAVQMLAEAEFDQPIQSFVITGASKRGWTSWLTPVVDRRIVATAPVVIDVLNFRAQMNHQLATWGHFSDQIRDYSSKGLIVTGDESEREKQLRLMMDPYTYRRQLTLPKLLVNATNDPYWVCDAMKWYWPDLIGPAYVLQIPNAGHGLGTNAGHGLGTNAGHGLGNGKQQALSTIAAFTRSIAARQPLPELDWHVRTTDSAATVTVTSSVPPRAARLWSARSTDLDFRDETWKPTPMDTSTGSFSGTIQRTGDTHIAFFSELEFAIDGVPYSLCTIIHRE